MSGSIMKTVKIEWAAMDGVEIPEVIRGKKLGLMPHKTGVSCVIWILHPAVDCPITGRVLIETTPGKIYEENRTTFQIMPAFVRLRGRYDWTESALVWYWLMGNQPLVEAFWKGSITDGQEIAAAVTELSPAISNYVAWQGKQIDAWKAREEIIVQTTGGPSREYAGFETPLK